MTLHKHAISKYNTRKTNNEPKTGLYQRNLVHPVSLFNKNLNEIRSLSSFLSDARRYKAPKQLKKKPCLGNNTKHRPSPNEAARLQLNFTSSTMMGRRN